MEEILSEGVSGDFKLEKFEVKKTDLRAALEGIPPGQYIRLLHKNTIVMSNTPMEKITNLGFIRKAFGDILIGGLGIGLIIFPLLDNDVIKSITVVEKYEDVIKLVASQISFDKRLTVINDDIFLHTPQCQYDCIYLDIWSFINEDVYLEMKSLKKRYQKHLKINKDSFISCWAEDEAKNGRKLY